MKQSQERTLNPLFRTHSGIFHGSTEALVGLPKGERPKEVALRVGVHTSIAGALVNAIDHAQKIGCDTFQIFSANPRGWRTSEPAASKYKEFRTRRTTSGLGPLVIHDNYLINQAAGDPIIRKKSVGAFRLEIKRALDLKADYLVFHPGSAKGDTVSEALRMCAASMKKAARGLRLNGLTLLVENTAGQGSTIGRSFEEVAEILNLAEGLPVGVCLDTAHCFEAGYPIHTAVGLSKTLRRIGKTFGIEKLRVIHANDSKTPFKSHADRHQHIGKGYIGLESFRRIVNHKALKYLPFICETPVDTPGDDERNIRTMRSLVRKSGSYPRASSKRQSRAARAD